MKNSFLTSVQKSFAIIAFALTFSLSAFAQNSNLQGVSLHATELTYDLESDEKIKENQIFSFSFKDKIFVHHLMEGDMVAQVYSIVNVDYTTYDGFVNYKTTVKSGISGSEYVYNVFVLDADNSVIVEYDGSYYFGTSCFIRSFKQ